MLVAPWPHQTVILKIVLLHKANMSNLIPAAKREYKLQEVNILVLGYFLKTQNFNTEIGESTFTMHLCTGDCMYEGLLDVCATKTTHCVTQTAKRIQGSSIRRCKMFISIAFIPLNVCRHALALRKKNKRSGPAIRGSFPSYFPTY